MAIPSVVVRHLMDHKACPRNIRLARFRPDVPVVCLGPNDAYMDERIVGNEPPYLPRARNGPEAFTIMTQNAWFPYIDSWDLTSFIPMWLAEFRMGMATNLLVCFNWGHVSADVARP